MFDAAYCKALRCQETPVLSLGALRDLRQLVDAASLPCDPNNSTKEAHDGQTRHQTQLPLASETADHPLPETVMAKCRQLIAQLLREVLLAEKEAHDEQ